MYNKARPPQQGEVREIEIDAASDAVGAWLAVAARWRSRRDERERDEPTSGARIESPFERVTRAQVVEQAASWRHIAAFELRRSHSLTLVAWRGDGTKEGGKERATRNSKRERARGRSASRSSDMCMLLIEWISLRSLPFPSVAVLLVASAPFAPFLLSSPRRNCLRRGATWHSTRVHCSARMWLMQERRGRD